MKNMIIKHKALVIIIAALLLAGLGFSIGMLAKTSFAENSDIGIENAKTIALESAGVSPEKAVFTKAKSERDDGTLLYEIEFFTGVNEYEFKIDAKTGEILEKESGTVDSGAAIQQPSQQPSSGQTIESTTQTGGASKAQKQSTSSTDYIGIDKAKKIALNQAGISDSSAPAFTKAHLDSDDGIQTYEIEFIAQNTEYSYEINAYTGEILECETDQVYDHHWEEHHDEHHDFY